MTQLHTPLTHMLTHSSGLFLKPPSSTCRRGEGEREKERHGEGSREECISREEDLSAQLLQSGLEPERSMSSSPTRMTRQRRGHGSLKKKKNPAWIPPPFASFLPPTCFWAGGHAAEAHGGGLSSVCLRLNGKLARREGRGERARKPRSRGAPGGGGRRGGGGLVEIRAEGRQDGHKHEFAN